MSTINVTNLSGRGGATPNLPDGANITGVATATTFSGTLDGSLKSTGTPTLGLGVTINASGVNVSGVLTATTYYGDGSNLAGVGESIAPWHYNPDVNDTLATIATGIGITFNKKVLAGSGTATLKIVNAGTAGTTIQSWGVSSCTFATTEFTFGSLVSDLIINQTYQVDIPGTFIDDAAGNSYVGTAYTFTIQDAADKLWMWGFNTQGQLGQNNTVKYSSPVQVPGENWKDTWGSIGDGWGAIAEHTLISKTDGTLWGWGQNEQGQLAQNNRTHRSSPIQIPGTTWSTISRSYMSSFAVKTDGTFWAWGFNEYGQLGDNSTATKSSPVQLPGTTWANAAAGYVQSFGIKTDGTLWVWGDNANGALGLNQAEPVRISSPVQIPGTTWSKIAGAKYYALAVKTDGTFWAWGKNEFGNLGQNNRTSYSSPVQIPGTTWSKAEEGWDHAFATRTDGTLWSWGYNGDGNLGLNNRTTYSSPVQVGSDTTWSKIAAGRYHPTAIKTDGTLWAWGDNENGQLAQNNATMVSSPVQVGSSTEWSAISTGREFSLAIQRDQTP